MLGGFVGGGVLKRKQDDRELVIHEDIDVSIKERLKDFSKYIFPFISRIWMTKKKKKVNGLQEESRRKK